MGRLRWTELPATDKQVKVAFCEVVHMLEGKMVEGFGDLDNLGMLQQLGIGQA